MVSPIAVKLAVQDLAKTGSIVGRIYAAGAVGSIVGTFATGFFLISWFGTHTVVWAVAIVLLVLGAVFFLSGTRENSRRGHIDKAVLLLALLGIMGAHCWPGLRAGWCRDATWRPTTSALRFTNR